MPALRTRRATAAPPLVAGAALAALLTWLLGAQPSARATAPVPARAAADTSAWWRHVTVLAHDSMRGRATGSAEHREAAEYVARAFARAGLRPAGAPGRGYLQPVRLVERRVDEARSSLALVRGGRAEPLALGTDAYLGAASAAPPGPIEAPVVFAGYGLHLPERGHDDFAGLDLRGKVVAALVPSSWAREACGSGAAVV